MAITFEDKEFLYENASIPDKNKIKDSDINALKNGVNTNESNIGALETSFTDSVTYSTTETVIGTEDNKTLYRRKYSTTTITTGSWQQIATDSTYDIKRYSGYLKRTNNRLDGFVPNGNSEYAPLIVTIRNNALEYQIGSAYGTNATEVYFYIEYTKTTD